MVTLSRKYYIDPKFSPDDQNSELFVAVDLHSAAMPRAACKEKPLGLVCGAHAHIFVHSAFRCTTANSLRSEKTRVAYVRPVYQYVWYGGGIPTHATPSNCTTCLLATVNEMERLLFGNLLSFSCGPPQWWQGKRKTASLQPTIHIHISTHARACALAHTRRH